MMCLNRSSIIEIRAPRSERRPSSRKEPGIDRQRPSFIGGSDNRVARDGQGGRRVEGIAAGHGRGAFRLAALVCPGRNPSSRQTGGLFGKESMTVAPDLLNRRSISPSISAARASIRRVPKPAPPISAQHPSSLTAQNARSYELPTVTKMQPERDAKAWRKELLISSATTRLARQHRPASIRTGCSTRSSSLSPRS